MAADNNKLLNLGGYAFFSLHPLVKLAKGADGDVARVFKGDASTGQGSVDSNCRILYGTVSADTTYQGLALTHASACKKPVKIELSSVATNLPIFHLPYNNDQNHRVTLRDRQGIGNANLFLTEFVDGCSIYVEGSLDRPTVYHINAKQTVRVPKRFRYWTAKSKLQADWQAKTDRMDSRFHNDALQRPKQVRNWHPGLAPLPPPTKLENQDYMAPVNIDVAALQGLNKIPTVISGQSVDGVELWAQQGSVFGERDAVNNTWAFYVQKRALVGHLHSGVANPIGFQWLITSVDEFWPNTTTGRLVA